jgi:hypothetical protein
MEIVQRQIPGPLWIALVCLGLMVFGKCLAMFKVGPLILIDAALSGGLLWGLANGKKWAYILTLIAVAFGTIQTTARAGVAAGFTVLIVDCLVLVPVLICTNWFFPEMDERDRAKD